MFESMEDSHLKRQALIRERPRMSRCKKRVAAHLPQDSWPLTLLHTLDGEILKSLLSTTLVYDLQEPRQLALRFLLDNADG